MKNLKFTNLLLLALSLLLIVSCGKFDDSALWQAINKHTEEIAALKEKCNTLNSDIESLKRIIESLQTRDYVTSCTPLSDGSGYTIVFYSGNSIVIKNGTDGADGSIPQIGIDKFTDGLYYWTLNEEWLLDKEGKMIRADGKDGEDGEDGQDGEDGITPKLKIEDGDWYLSIDNGATWTNLGKATGKDGKDGQDAQSLFNSVTPGEDCVIFELNDGTELKVPYYSEISDIAITGDYSDLTAYSVTLYGWCNQEEEEGHSAQYGIEYSATDLTTARSTVIAESRDQDNKFCCSLTKLHPNTKYYYRAFTYFDKYFYGEVKTFTTLDGPDVPEKATMILDPTELNFDATATSQTVQVTCNRDWKVSETDVPEWISLTVDGEDIKGKTQKASPYSMTVTVTVLENNSFERACNIKFNGGTLATKTLTVKQAGSASYTTIAEVRALNPDKSAKVNAPDGTIVKGIVISNAKLNNFNSPTLLYVQDATAGICIKCSANHDFVFGDEVVVDLSGVSLEYYNNLFQANGEALDKISVLSSGNTPEPVQVSVADFLAGKYESRYVELNEDVQVVEADLSKNWVVGDSHTSIKMETKSGSNFIVQSSKYSSFKDTKVSQGSGKIKGIATVYNDQIQIAFAQLSDFAGLTEKRF